MVILSKIKSYLRFIFSNPLQCIICIAWGNILLGYWRGINNKIPLLGKFTDELEYLIVLVPLFFSLKYWPKLLKSADIVFVLCCILYYLFNYLIYPENADYLDERFFSFGFLVLPYFFVGTTLDIKKYLDVFYLISVLSIIVCCFYQFFYVQSASYSGNIDSAQYNMAFSYNILPHVLLVTWLALCDLKIWKILVMLLGLFILLALGTRGPVICEIIFIMVYLLLLKPTKHKVLKNITILTIGICILNFIEQIMLSLQLLMIQMGLSTRIFDIFFEGELTTSDGRNTITTTLLSELKVDDSILGHGILGSYNYVSTYPHNIFVDFVFTFGWIPGIALLIAIFTLILFAFYHAKTEERSFLLLLFCATIVKLNLSGTFIDDALFFMLIGYCIHCIRESRIIR